MKREDVVIGERYKLIKNRRDALNGFESGETIVVMRIDYNENLQIKVRQCRRDWVDGYTDASNLEEIGGKR